MSLKSVFLSICVGHVVVTNCLTIAAAGIVTMGFDGVIELPGIFWMVLKLVVGSLYWPVASWLNVPGAYGHFVVLLNSVFWGLLGVGAVAWHRQRLLHR